MFRSPSHPLTLKHLGSDHIARVLVTSDINKGLLDAPRRYEAIKDTDRPGFIVRAACSSTAEWLLANDSARTLVIVVNISGGIAKTIGGVHERTTIRCESGTTILSTDQDEEKNRRSYMAPEDGNGRRVRMGCEKPTRTLNCIPVSAYVVVVSIKSSVCS